MYLALSLLIGQLLTGLDAPPQFSPLLDNDRITLNSHAEFQLASAQNNPQNDWRYKFENGHWWYWLPSNEWAFWNGSQWIKYTPDVYQSYWVSQQPEYNDGYYNNNGSYYGNNNGRNYWRGGYYGNRYFGPGWYAPGAGPWGYGYRNPGAAIGGNIGGQIGGYPGAAIGAGLGASIGNNNSNWDNRTGSWNNNPGNRNNGNWNNGGGNRNGANAYRGGGGGGRRGRR